MCSILFSIPYFAKTISNISISGHVHCVYILRICENFLRNILNILNVTCWNNIEPFYSVKVLKNYESLSKYLSSQELTNSPIHQDMSSKKQKDIFIAVSCSSYLSITLCRSIGCTLFFVSTSTFLMWLPECLFRLSIGHYFLGHKLLFFPQVYVLGPL